MFDYWWLSEHFFGFGEEVVHLVRSETPVGEGDAHHQGGYEPNSNKGLISRLLPIEDRGSLMREISQSDSEYPYFLTNGTLDNPKPL